MKIPHLINMIKPELANSEFEALQRRIRRMAIESEKTYREAIKMYNDHKGERVK